jgi:hypothetical protein
LVEVVVVGVRYVIPIICFICIELHYKVTR